MKDYEKNYQRFIHYLFRDTDSVEQALFELRAAHLVSDGYEPDNTEASYWQHLALEAWDHKWSKCRYYSIVLDLYLS